VRNLILGAVVAVGLLACAAAASWDEARIADLEADVVALKTVANDEAFLRYELEFQVRQLGFAVFGAPDPVPEFPLFVPPFPGGR